MELLLLLLLELTNAADRLRCAAAGAATLAPRLPALPFLLQPPPALPALPPPPAPPLMQSEEIYLRTVVELEAGLLGVQPAELGALDAALGPALLPPKTGQGAAAGPVGPGRVRCPGGGGSSSADGRRVDAPLPLHRSILATVA